MNEDRETDQQRRAELLKKLNGDLSKQALLQGELDTLKDQQLDEREKLDKNQKRKHRIERGIWGIKNLADILGENQEIKSQYAKIEEQLDRFGGTAGALENLEDLSKEIEESYSIFSILWKSLFKGPKRTLWLSLITLLSVVMVGTAFKYLPLPDLVSDIEGILAKLVAGLGSALSISIVPGIAWAKGILGKLNSANKIVKQTLAAHPDQEKPPSSKEIQALDQSIELGENNLTALEEEIEATKTQIHKLSPDVQLKNFIDARTASQDYRKHQGIVSTVRRDFEKLSQLMLNRKGWQHEEVLATVETADDYYIDRIVLYIDDLDRCPPSQVVEVLQAVHLLLAFPLFVVVVGVDSRWISKSLYLHYKSIWDAKDEGEQKDGRKMGPYDYLEKIFQIPYWVRKMKPEDTETYIGKLLDELGEADERPKTNGDRMGPPTDEAEESQNSPESDDSIDEKPALQEEQDVIESGYNNTDSTNTNAAPDAEEKVDEPQIDNNGPEVQDEPDDDAERELSPNDLEERSRRSSDLSKEEKDYMKALATMVNRSPRSTKRFVNVYRIIRASHAVAVTTGEERGAQLVAHDYKAILFLIAVLIGQPELVQGFFSKLRSHENTSQLLSEFLDQYDELAQLTKIFKQMSQATPAHNNLNISALKAYQDLVARYSFRVGDLEQDD